MAFEFLSNALRGAVDFFGGLGGEVGNGRANEEEDVRKVRRAMTTLGRLDEPEEEPNGIIDRPLDTAIRGFQRDKGLRVDGFMRPGGPTEQSLQSDLRGFLKQDEESEGGFGGLRTGALNPADTLPGERATFGLFDRGAEASDRASGLLEIAERATSARRASDVRLAQDRADEFSTSERLGSSTRASGSDRDASAGGDPSRIKTAAALAPQESEPTRLTPALDKMERNLRRTEEGWRQQGMTDAARHLKHFLDGSGEPITYNRDQARSFGPVRNAEEDAQKQLREEVLKRARGLKDGESSSIQITRRGEHRLLGHGLDLLRGWFGDTDRFNDNLATGRTAVTSTFKGTIRRDGDDISVDGFVDHDWGDTYDFHVAQPGAAAANSLARYRGARTFTFGGKWRQRLSGDTGRDGLKLKFVDLN